MRRAPLLLRRFLESGRSADAFASAADSSGLVFVLKPSFVGAVLRIAFAGAVESQLLAPLLLCKLLLRLPEAALPIECRFLSFELARCRSCSFGSTLLLLCVLPFLAKPGYAYGLLGLASGAFGLMCFHTSSTASSRAAWNSFSSCARSSSSMAMRTARASSCSACRCWFSRYCTLGVRERSIEVLDVSRPRGGRTSGRPPPAITSSMLVLDALRACGWDS